MGQRGELFADAACLLVELVESLVILYYLRTLRYVVYNARIASDLPVDFSASVTDPLVLL